MRRSRVTEIAKGVIIDAGGGPETGIPVGRALWEQDWCYVFHTWYWHFTSAMYWQQKQASLNTCKENTNLEKVCTGY